MYIQHIHNERPTREYALPCRCNDTPKRFILALDGVHPPCVWAGCEPAVMQTTGCKRVEHVKKHCTCCVQRRNARGTAHTRKYCKISTCLDTCFRYIFACRVLCTKCVWAACDSFFVKATVVNAFHQLYNPTLPVILARRARRTAQTRKQRCHRLPKHRIRVIFGRKDGHSNFV